MKLRIKDNSVRFRLLRGEVRSLADRGSIEARMLLSLTDPEKKFSYGIVHGAQYSAIGIEQSCSLIRLTVPTHEVLAWANGDDVGIYSQHEVYGGEMLTIAIEKDFACLDGSEIDNRDTFENPNTGMC